MPPDTTRRGGRSGQPPAPKLEEVVMGEWIDSVDISKMLAGSQMDIAVGSYVFGWTGVWNQANTKLEWWYDESIRDYWIHSSHFSPSTNVMTAFTVVAYMQERGYWLMLKSPFFEGHFWFAGFTPVKRVASEYGTRLMAGESAAASICRAALVTCRE